MKIKKGQLIIISDGEYDDYQIVNTFRALKDFDTNEVMREFLIKHPEADGNLHSLLSPRTINTFQCYLIETGMAEEVHTTEWHIADYGKPNFDEDK